MAQDRASDKFIDRILFGGRKMRTTLRHQMRRIIVICCTVAVFVQAVVMIALIMNSYIRNVREDTLYILQSNNESMVNAIRFLEEHIISLRHDSHILDFFRNENTDKETVSAHLHDIANLFSDGNRQGLQRPFVTEIYLFNKKQESIRDIYYPKTVTLQQQRLTEIHACNQRFLRQSRPFYYEVSEDDIRLCLYLYDTSMKILGSCTVVLDRGFITEAYSGLEKYTGYAFEIRSGEEILVTGNTYGTEPENVLENVRQTGFGLTLRASVSGREIYRSLGSTMAFLIVISTLVITAVTIIGSLIAHRFVRPLETVAEKIRQVGAGDFQTKLGEYRAEELNHISGTFNEMTGKIDYLITQVYEARLLNQQAQIKYLQAQMDPHFLFNVLSMIGMRASLNRDEEVHKMIFMLSRLLQGKIFRKNEIEITLGDEMEIVEFYLYLQNHRFGDKITYDIVYDGDETDMRKLMVPRLSIEPWVENAVAHGLEPKEGNGHIQVTVHKNSILTIRVTDDGVGFDPDKAESKASDDKAHSHVGLMNTDKMIKNLYGGDYGVTIKSIIGKGTTVTVCLPVKERDDGNVEGDGR